MIYKSSNHVRFDRKDKILYEVVNISGAEQSVPLFVYKNKHPDKIGLKKSAIEYLKKYMEMFPGLWEYYKEEKKNTNEQLKLF